MRVLIATDGSTSSLIAVDLAAGLRWPDGSTLRACVAVDPLASIAMMPWTSDVAVDPREIEESLVAEAQQRLDGAAARLAAGRYEVDRALLRGRPASAIVEEAERWPADLVVVGSRGHGRITSMLLGSVSAEVVDHAPCPVLVARHGSVTRAMLATDGSDTAMAAEAPVLTMPVFRDVPVDVLSVGELPDPRPGPVGQWDDPWDDDRVLADRRLTIDDALRIQKTIAEDAATRLRAGGSRAEAHVAAGDPAETIVAVADRRKVDLIALGTHGRTGLERLRLGSVARNVLLHTTASVLITRRASTVGA